MRRNIIFPNLSFEGNLVCQANSYRNGVISLCCSFVCSSVPSINVNVVLFIVITSGKGSIRYMNAEGVDRVKKDKCWSSINNHHQSFL